MIGMKKIFTVLLLSLLLTGCCRLNTNIKVDTDASTRTSGTFEISSEPLAQLGFSIDNMLKLFGDIGIDLKQDEFSYSYNEEDNYIGINFVFDGNDYIDAVREGNEVTVTLSSPDITDYVDLDVFGDNGNDLSFLKDLGAELTVTVEMPGSIKSFSKGEKIAYNRIRLDVFEGIDDVTITSYAFDLVFYLYIFIALTAVIAAVLVLVLKKTKKMVANAYDHHEMLR